MEKKLRWNDVKNFLNTRKIPAQYIEFEHHYLVEAIDGPHRYWTEIGKTDPAPEGSDQEDFEDNYKPDSNKTYSDNDGTFLYRMKISPKGWRYFQDYLEFETSKLSSLYHKDHEGTDCGYVTVKFYDSEDAELTIQDDIDNSCIKTVIDWMPPHDFEIIGGGLRMKNQPQTDLRTWVVAVPDVPSIYGGSKEFLRNMNLAYLNNPEFSNDGRVPKYMKYDAVNKTNKFRAIFKHAAGEKHKVQLHYNIFIP